MAGKKQHHVWRALQRGFSFSDKGPDQIWVYSKDAPARQSVTKKFGQDEFFYGEPDVDADKNITNFENSVQGFVQEARKLNDGETVDREASATLLSHLEIRSQFIRDEFSRLGDRAIRFVRDQFSSKRNFRTLANAYLRKHPEMLEAELEKAGIDKNLWPTLKEMIVSQIPGAIDNTQKEVGPVFATLFDGLLESLVDIAKKSHNRSLLSNFSELERTAMHRQLKYSVMRVPSPGFILPDTCAAFFLRGGVRPVSSKKDFVEAAVIPISADTAIIGEAKGNSNRDMAVINRALASCAFKNFLSPIESPDLQRLTSRIGNNAKLVSDAEIQRIFRIDTLLEGL